MNAIWTPAYVALGSNLSEPHAQVERGFVALSALAQTKLIARSRLYVSKPFGSVVQPDFVNAAAGLITQLDPHELLATLKRLETELGRALPVQRWGPRLIDFDLLAYADVSIDDTNLTVPHPGIPERNFVLYPLRDIAPDLLLPRMGVVRQLAARASGEGLQVLA